MRNIMKSMKFAKFMLAFILAAVGSLVAATTVLPVSVKADERHILECKDHITVNKTGHVNIRCIRYDDISTISLSCKNEDSSVADVSWGQWKEDNSVDLKIKGKKKGKTRVTIYNSYNHETKVIDITVNGKAKKTAASTNGITSDMIVGKWSPDVNAEQPIYIDFSFDGDVMTFDMYQMVKSFGQVSKFEYNSGYVNLFYDQQYGWLEVGSSGRNYKTIYLQDVANGVIYDEDGTAFYKVQ